MYKNWQFILHNVNKYNECIGKHAFIITKWNSHNKNLPFKTYGILKEINEYYVSIITGYYPNYINLEKIYTLSHNEIYDIYVNNSNKDLKKYWNYNIKHNVKYNQNKIQQNDLINKIKNRYLLQL